MILNGSPQGPGFLIFFNIQDTSSGFQRVSIEEIKEPDDVEVLELITLMLTSRLLDG